MTPPASLDRANAPSSIAVRALREGEAVTSLTIVNTPVGIGALVVERSELRACYVLPEAARCGVGTAVVAEIERLACDHGLHRLELAGSLNAEPFYAALGYSVRERGEVLLSNQHRMPCVWMEKMLTR